MRCSHRKKDKLIHHLREANYSDYDIERFFDRLKRGQVQEQLHDLEVQRMRLLDQMMTQEKAPDRIRENERALEHIGSVMDTVLRKQQKRRGAALR